MISNGRVRCLPGWGIGTAGALRQCVQRLLDCFRLLAYLADDVGDIQQPRRHPDPWTLRQFPRPGSGCDNVIGQHDRSTVFDCLSGLDACLGLFIGSITTVAKP